MLNKPIPRSNFNVVADLQILRTVTVDGTVENQFDSVACVRASLVARSSMTIKQSDRVFEGATHLLIVDYRPEINGATRFVVGGRTFEIKGIPRRDREPNARYLEIDAVEVV